MEEKRGKDKRKSKHTRHEKKSYREPRNPSSGSSESDEWVEKEVAPKTNQREDWMSMTGMLKTYTKKDIKPKREEREKKHIDSYDPSTSSKELNPYWKHGGAGLPETSESFRKSRPFMKPSDDDDYYSKTSTLRDFKKTDNYNHSSHFNDSKNSNKYSHNSGDSYKSYNWRKGAESNDQKVQSKDRQFIGGSNYRKNNDQSKKGYHWRRGSDCSDEKKYSDKQPKDCETKSSTSQSTYVEQQNVKSEDSCYLSDEKMNKLGAKIVKAEIMGDMELVEKLKQKLEAARNYRKQNPNAGKEGDDRVMLTLTNSVGNSMPLIRQATGDPRSKSAKRKTETHNHGQRIKYFGNDDQYDLAQMFQQEKYGNNYDNDKQLAKITSKHKNPNDDLEDIFVDEISKQCNQAKDNEKEKQGAINQHIKMEKSLEGCEYCVGSKNMIKHLMVSCGNRVYLAMPAMKSMVTGQCIITTVQHTTCVTALDEDVWEEIMNYRKALVKFFNAQNKDVIFFETAMKLHKFPHMVINCMPLPRDVGDMASIYFKKALLECEAEWAMNKKVIDLKGKNIRKCVPKGLPYFWVDFGLDPGFAHVIEDQHLFPRNFAEEIVGGMLELDHHLWKNPKREYGDVQLKKVSDFLKEWKPYDIAVKNN